MQRTKIIQLEKMRDDWQSEKVKMGNLQKEMQAGLREDLQLALQDTVKSELEVAKIADAKRAIECEWEVKWKEEQQRADALEVELDVLLERFAGSEAQPEGEKQAAAALEALEQVHAIHPTSYLSDRLAASPLPLSVSCLVLVVFLLSLLLV